MGGDPTETDVKIELVSGEVRVRMATPEWFEQSIHYALVATKHGRERGVPTVVQATANRVFSR